MAAATRNGSSVVFSAVTDTYAAQIVDIVGVTFQGTGLTIGQRLELVDDGGDPIADYVVGAATDNADLWNGRGPKFYYGLKFPAGAVAGTWVLSVFLN